MPDGDVLSVRFSPDGTSVAAVEDAGGQHVRLWHLPSGEVIGVLPGAGHFVEARAAFTPDGEELVLAHQTGPVLIWDVDPESWREHACMVVGRSLTREEWKELLPNQPYREVCPEYGP